MQVEIWSDVVCPWCYLGKRRFERALAAFPGADDVEVIYRSFELDPTAARRVTSPTVELLASKYGMGVGAAEDAQRQMVQRAAADGLSFSLDGQRSGNTRDAHRLLHLAAAQGRQAVLVEGLHRAYFTERKSVFDVEPLTEIAVEAGLDAASVRRVLAGTEYDEDVTADETLASDLGATGVPFFVFDRRYGVSGAQSSEVLLEALHRASSTAA